MKNNLIIMDTSGVLTFDGLEGVAWKVFMRHNVAQRGVRIINVAPGQLYTFIFQQDGNGKHTMQWPSQAIGGAQVDLNPDATSVQNFIGDVGGRIRAVMPGAWGQH